MQIRTVLVASLALAGPVLVLGCQDNSRRGSPPREVSEPATPPAAAFGDAGTFIGGGPLDQVDASLTGGPQPYDVAHDAGGGYGAGPADAAGAVPGMPDASPGGPPGAAGVGTARPWVPGESGVAPPPNGGARGAGPAGTNERRGGGSSAGGTGGSGGGDGGRR
jgi:hypothetical protein